MKDRFSTWKWNILSLALFLVVWEIAALSLDNNYLFPSVSLVAETLITISGSSLLYNNLSATFVRSLECLIVSFVVALPLSYLISKSSVVEKLLSPFLYFMKNTPVIAFLLLALIWIPAENVPLFIAIIGMLPILVINFAAGFRSVDHRYMELASLYHLSFFRRFSYIEYPAVKSYLFAGLSSALGLGWRAIIIGEALASVKYGLGAAMRDAQNYVDVPYLFAITIVSLLASYLIEKLIQFFAKIDLYKLFRQTHSLANMGGEDRDIVLKVSDLTFQRNSVKLFEAFSLQLKRGDILLLKGKSGVGKSTLIDIIGGFERAYDGTVCSGEKSILFQDQRLCPWLNVADNIDMILPVSVGEDERKMMYDIMGITNLMDRMPGEISGGEAQRVSLCRTLLYPAQLYVLDEPLTGIGENQKKELLIWIRSYVKDKQLSVLWISHDEDQADIADRIVAI